MPPASTRIVVVQAAETLAEALFLLGLARKFSWIAGIVAWVDPALAGDRGGSRGAARGTRCVKGVRPIRDDNRIIAWMLDARLDRGWQALAAAGLVPRHPGAELGARSRLPRRLARRHPGLSIVLDHCAKPDIAGGLLRAVGGGDRRLRRLPQRLLQALRPPQLRGPGRRRRRGSALCRPCDRRLRRRTM